MALNDKLKKATIKDLKQASILPINSYAIANEETLNFESDLHPICSCGN